MKITQQLATRLLEDIEQIEDKVEAEFFIKLSSYALLFLRDIIDKESNLIFHRKGKEIDESQIYNGEKIVMSALFSIFLENNVFTGGLEDLGSRLKKVLSDTFNFSEQDRETLEDLIRLRRGKQKGGPNIGDPGWGMKVHACLIKALIFEHYPVGLDKVFSPDRELSEIKEYWGKAGLDFGITNEFVAKSYISFQANIPADFFVNWKP